MRIFFAGQGRTKVCGEAYWSYAAAGNLRRTPASGKKAIYGWTLFSSQAELTDNLNKGIYLIAANGFLKK